jgi:hypothetical protein
LELYVYQTGGLIEKRYANQDAAGQQKSQFTGREDIAKMKLILFEYPIFGRCR